MTNIDKKFYGTIAGIVPSIWVVSFLFHLYPIDNTMNVWWSFAWILTQLFLGLSIPLFIGILISKFGYHHEA